MDGVIGGWMMVVDGKSRLLAMRCDAAMKDEGAIAHLGDEVYELSDLTDDDEKTRLFARRC